MELVHKRLPGKLTRVYTQNIDGLDYQCDLPDNKIVPVRAPRPVLYLQAAARHPAHTVHNPPPTLVVSSDF